MTAATIEFAESNGGGETVYPASGSGSITNVNMGSNDSYQIVPATYPLPATGYSYEKYHRFRVPSGGAGTSTGIKNLTVWMSTNGLTSGVTLDANLKTSAYSARTYATPVNTDSSGTGGATITFPTSDPGANTPNLGIATALANTMDITSGLPKYSDYICSQITTSAATTGSATTVITYRYDEIG
jgi:hypothetical protein